MFANSCYEEGLFVGYRWYHMYKMLPNYAFGFGLSYATFELNDITLADDTKCSAIDQNCEIIVTITRMDEAKEHYERASEVVQLYVDVSLLLLINTGQKINAMTQKYQTNSR